MNAHALCQMIFFTIVFRATQGETYFQAGSRKPFRTNFPTLCYPTLQQAITLQSIDIYQLQRDWSNKIHQGELFCQSSIVQLTKNQTGNIDICEFV